MVQDIATILGHGAVGILVVSLILWSWKYRHLPLLIKILGLYLGLNIATEVYAKWLFWQNEHNLFLLHIYTILEFLAWSIFYKYLLFNEQWFQKYFWQFVSLVVVLLIANTLFLEPFNGFNSNAKTLVQVILISYALLYFFSAYGVVDFSKRLNQSIGLINFAVILYYSGSLFIFMFTKILLENNASWTTQRGYWLFNALLNLVFQILIFFSIWNIAFRQTKSSS